MDLVCLCLYFCAVNFRGCPKCIANDGFETKKTMGVSADFLHLACGDEYVTAASSVLS